MKKIIARVLPLLFWPTLGAAVTLFSCSAFASAAAAVSDPSPALQSGIDASIDVWAKDGPWWLGVAVVVVALRTFLSKQHWLVQGRLLTGLGGVAALGIAALQWHFNGAPFGGILTAAVGAAAALHVPTVPGAAAKTAGAAGIVVVLLLGGGTLPMTGCATAKAIGKTTTGDVVTCTTSDRERIYAQFGPTMEQAIQRATGMDGKIDLPSLETITKSLTADGWCVVERTAGRLIAAALAKIDGSPQSAAAPIDARDLAAKVASLRVAKFGATQFQLPTP